MFPVLKLFLSQNSSSHSRLSSSLILPDMSLSKCQLSYSAPLLSSFHSATVHHNPSSSSSELPHLRLKTSTQLTARNPKGLVLTTFALLFYSFDFRLKSHTGQCYLAVAINLPTACLGMGCSSVNVSPERSKDLAPICGSSCYCISGWKKCLSNKQTNKQTIKKYIW